MNRREPRRRLETTAVRSALVLLAVLLLIGPAAADDETGGEIGIIGGAILPDESVTGPGNDDISAAIGFRTGATFTRNWTWFLDGLFAPIDAAPAFGGDAEELIGRTGFEYLFTPERDARFFIAPNSPYNADPSSNRSV